MIVRVVIVFIILVSLRTAESIRCYECVSRLGPGESSACLTGEEGQLRRVQCIGPSVCAVYHYQTVIPGTPTINHITRGCQALRYGATCEDIFNELRARGQVLPGQHTCTTCSSDLCNSSGKLSYSVTIWSFVFALIKRFL
ncbi:unnamed protein product [Acanthoscelides obtectus]|uniref:Protein sleepless n=1 Tax=Acanthoscelides obtectus TaxID=200917 RepID=A0A9P0LJG9_ACAOB|nr:unnamed protein product [Acanthoscelides obtectus]CAK1679917.1 hypothetical protein AOBTE_LOCUS32455 [Acanthoscelides obtectus]